MIKSKRNGGYLFVLPAVIFMVIFIGYPLIYNIILSFQNVDLAALTSGNKSFVGFDNYKQLFSMEVFGISVKNTIVYTLGSVVFQVALSSFLLYSSV